MRRRFVHNGPPAGGICMYLENDLLESSPPVSSSGFGAAVAIDGEWAVVAARVETAAALASAGAVYVFRKVLGVWSQFQRVISPTPEVGGSFGSSVALEGTRLVVGAISEDGGNTNAGKVHIFQFNGATWAHAHTVLSNATLVGENFGISVSLEGDRLAVGAYAFGSGAGNRRGFAYVFDYNGVSWVKTTATPLQNSDSQIGDQFGQLISLSGDRLAVGALLEDGAADAFPNQGAVYMFDFNGLTWTETTKIMPPDPQASKAFARMSLFGTTLLIGALGDNEALGVANGGACYYYTWNGAAWVFVQKFFPTMVVGDPQGFGAVVSRRAETRVVIGAIQEDDLAVNAGTAYIWEREAGGWVQKQRLAAGGVQALNDQYGFWAQLDDADQLIVGISGYDSPGFTNSGGAYVYDRIC